MKRLYIFLGICWLLLACGGGGQEQPEEQDVQADSGAWCVAVMPTLDCLPLYLASDRHLFEDEGLSVHLTAYQAQMDIDTALLVHRATAAMTDLARVEHLRQQQADIETVAATDLSWQLISKRSSRIKKLAQLDDKMLAMTRYSGTDLLTDLVVDSAKLKDERLFRIQVNDVNIRLGMLQADIMDAMFLPEPQATTARNQKGYVMLDTRQKDIRLGVLVFQHDTLKLREQEVQRFLKVYNRAVDSLNQHGLNHYADLMERYLGILHTTIDSLPKNFEFHHAQKPRQQDVERVSNWWNRRQASMKYVEKRYIQ